MNRKQIMKFNHPFHTPHQWTGKRKTKRSLHFKMSTHLILRLKDLLPPLFEPRDHDLHLLFYSLAQKYNIRIYRLVFNHSHMHAVVLLPNRQNYVSFIRELTSALTRYFTKRLNVFGLRFTKIFKSRPFTRSTPWGRAYKTLLRYMDKNEMESGWQQRLRIPRTMKLRIISLILFSRIYGIQWVSLETKASQLSLMVL